MPLFVVALHGEYLLGRGGKLGMGWINLAQDGDRIGGLLRTW